MKNPRKITAISLLLLCLLLWSSVALAATAASVTHLSGPLLARKTDGTTKALSIGSKIDEGDTVITQKRTYARLKFSDGSEVTLKPDTQFRVEQHRYDQANPKNDVGSYNLIKGGLRTITGQIGKRGNQDSYRMKTPTATIGIRGTIYDAQFCTGNSCGAVEPGLYLAVADGQVVITNNEGVQTTLQVKAGQYVYVQNPTTPPVVLPTKPNIPFNPPPSVSQGSRGQGGEGGAAQGGGTTDCIVR
ncbi:FecR family protein [Trichlorobacter ammonificans]|nr:FecR domain-containing protein [Trichlorobacter ammonificans]